MFTIVRYYARVEKVYPPKYSSDARARDAHKDSSSSSTSSSLEDDAPHVIGGDLKIPTKDANVQDNPTLYFYWVHILELEKDKSHDKNKSAARSTEKDGKMVGSLMEVQCGMMRYDQSYIVPVRCLMYVDPVATVSLSRSRSFAGSSAIVLTVKPP